MHACFVGLSAPSIVLSLGRSWLVMMISGIICPETVPLSIMHVGTEIRRPV